MRTVGALLALMVVGQITSAEPAAKAFQKAAYSVVSPDRRITARVTVQDDLRYAVSFQGKTALLESPFGLEFRDAPPLGKGLTVRGQKRQTIHTTWENRWGKRRRVVDWCNELRLTLQESAAPRRTFDFIVRAYDDGVALRYVLPKQPGLESFTLTKEEMQFRFVGNPTVWAADYGGYSSPQESVFRKQPMAALASDKPYGVPLLVQVGPSLTVALTEADLQDWAGMYLSGAGEQGSGSGNFGLVTRLAPRHDKQGLAQATIPHASPWRVLLIGERPGDLVESDLILNLSEPCAIADTSWIKPGKCAWDHWWSGDVKMDTPTMKEYVRFAGEMGFPYQLVDWFWYGEPDKPTSDITKVNPSLDLPELIRFAKERNVRLLVWLHSNDVDRKLKAGELDDVFALYEKWGLAGVKIDFMDRDDQEMVNWYHTIIKKAAAHHLLVDFHGAYKPTGTHRTYPNQITREGVLGEEYAKFSNSLTPEHDCTLPFTRMLAGPMDYTPGGFRNRTQAQWKQTSPTEVMGTRCHELAKFVIFDSPLTVLCDHPDNYRNQPGLEFLRVVPTVWDETRIVDGAVGEFVISARKSGKVWFVGGMTNGTARTIQIPLRFLGSGQYTAHIFADAPDADQNAEHLTESRRPVTSGDTLTLPLAPGGGVAIHFTPN